MGRVRQWAGQDITKTTLVIKVSRGRSRARADRGKESIKYVKLPTCYKDDSSCYIGFLTEKCRYLVLQWQADKKKRYVSIFYIGVKSQFPVLIMLLQ